IIGYSEMILEDAADASPAVLGPMQQIRTNGTALLNLVNSRLDAAKIADAALEVPIAELCQEMRPPLDDVLNQAQSLCAKAEALGISGFLEDLQKNHDAGMRLDKELGVLRQRCDTPQELTAAAK